LKENKPHFVLEEKWKDSTGLVECFVQHECHQPKS
jgi:hypothetical protein